MVSATQRRRQLPPAAGANRIGFHIRGSVSGMRYALSGKNGNACKRTRVIPYVRIRHAICRAAANGCMRRTESLHVASHATKVTKSDGGSWGIRVYDVMVGCFLSLRQEKRVPQVNVCMESDHLPHTASACRSRMPLTLTAYMEY